MKRKSKAATTTTTPRTRTRTKSTTTAATAVVTPPSNKKKKLRGRSEDGDDGDRQRRRRRQQKAALAAATAPVISSPSTTNAGGVAVLGSSGGVVVDNYENRRPLSKNFEVYESLRDNPRPKNVRLNIPVVGERQYRKRLAANETGCQHCEYATCRCRYVDAVLREMRFAVPDRGGEQKRYGQCCAHSVKTPFVPFLDAKFDLRRMPAILDAGSGVGDFLFAAAMILSSTTPAATNTTPAATNTSGGAAASAGGISSNTASCVSTNSATTPKLYGIEYDRGNFELAVRRRDWLVSGGYVAENAIDLECGDMTEYFRTPKFARDFVGTGGDDGGGDRLIWCANYVFPEQLNEELGALMNRMPRRVKLACQVRVFPSRRDTRLRQDFVLARDMVDWTDKETQVHVYSGREEAVEES